MQNHTKDQAHAESDLTSENQTNAKKQGYQFIRQEGYARVKSSGQSWIARMIVEEALRVSDNCKHVTSPSQPIAHYGVKPEHLLKSLEEIEEESKKVMVDTAHGKRRQRSDTLILIALVASFPLPPSERERDVVQKWITRTIAWLVKMYGAAHLLSVIEHVDEGYIHLHVFVHNHGRSVKPLMAGHRERLSAIAAKLPPSEVRAAYRNAMIRFQDEYYSAVCEPLGLARKSPSPRPRLSRTAYIAQKNQDLKHREQELLDKEQKINAKTEALQKVQAELAQLALQLKLWEARLRSAAEKLAAKRDLLAASWRQFRAKVKAAAGTLLPKERNPMAAKDGVTSEQAQSEALWSIFRSKLNGGLNQIEDVQKPSAGDNIKRPMTRP